MRLQPRLQTLEVWHAVATYSRNGGGGWTWGGRHLRNSVSDAEQLLCLMYPAAREHNLALDQPDETAEDVLAALKPLGDSVEIPKVLVEVLTDYMETYRSAEDGTPSFAGDTYIESGMPGTELSKEQLALDLVDSYTMSMSLCLSTLSFLKGFSRAVTRQQLRDKIDRLEQMASARLTAAMVGLLRSFCVNVFEADSRPGKVLLRALNQRKLPERVVVDELRRTLRPVRASLRDARLGLSRDDSLDNENLLFEVGWSWGVVDDAVPIETTEDIGVQPDGVALSAPYLYYTVIALDAIADLTSDRTRVEGLLNQEQQRLAQALQLRWDIVLAYWSRIARFGPGRWPLEDVPWRTTDEEESEYFSLLVTAVVLLDLLARRATDDDLTRTVTVLQELAIRGRINRRAVKGDAAIALHFPGVRLTLIGADRFGPPVIRMVSDFPALLLKRAVRAAELSRNSTAREQLLTVAEQSLSHMWQRRLRKDGPAKGLWDDASELFPGVIVEENLPSWYLTERVIESLVIASSTLSARPIRSRLLQDTANDLLSEADHLFSQEQLEMSEQPGTSSALHSSLSRIGTKLQGARQLHQERPGTATSIITEVLRDLYELALARADATRGN